MLPEDNELPTSMNKANKNIFRIWCLSDCILYGKEYKTVTICPSCGMSSYKLKKNTLKMGSCESLMVFFRLFKDLKGVTNQNKQQRI